MDPKRIYILSDDSTVREGLVAVFKQTGYEPVCFADENALFAGVRRRCPDCVLLDIPVLEHGAFHVMEELKQQVGFLTPIIVISGNHSARIAFRAGLIGATDFIERPFAMLDLIDSVEKATADQSRQRDFAMGLDAFCGSESLTKRQRQVLEEMLSGKSTKNIAFCLGLSPRTVEDHRANILDKAKVKSTVQLFAAIYEAGRNSTVGDAAGRNLPLEHDPEKWAPVSEKIMLKR